MIGRIFSIEEFSTFDGDGIRTTVFLKGCPLRCEWCHNPEGQEYKIQILKNKNGCLNCNKCIDINEDKNLSIKSVDACPRNLIRVSGIDYSSDELVNKLLKNKDILISSGGGITFSGGEPLFQYEFLKECLIKLEGKINRAIQTSGYCDTSKFNIILKHVDLVLFDLKIFDETEHIKYTKISNECIKKNYELLTKSNVKFITRIPLIPEATDNENNIRSIIRFMKSLNINYVELLTYNQFTKSKYSLLNKEFKITYNEQNKNQNIESILIEEGINYKIL